MISETLKRLKSSRHECEPGAHPKCNDLLAELDRIRRESTRYGAAANMTIEEEKTVAHVRE